MEGSGGSVSPAGTLRFVDGGQRLERNDRAVLDRSNHQIGKLESLETCCRGRSSQIEFDVWVWKPRSCLAIAVSYRVLRRSGLVPGLASIGTP